MPAPAYRDLINLSSNNGGLVSEGIEERMLTMFAILASGQNPDGTANAGVGATSPLVLTAHTAVETPLTINAAASQTANLLTVTSGTNTTIIDPNGNIAISNGSGQVGIGGDLILRRNNAALGQLISFNEVLDINGQKGATFRSYGTGSANPTFQTTQGGDLYWSDGTNNPGLRMAAVCGPNNSKWQLYTNQAASVTTPVLEIEGDGTQTTQNCSISASWGYLRLLASTWAVLAGNSGVQINGPLQLATMPAFVANDHYLVVDSSGHIHVSATGPAS